MFWTFNANKGETVAGESCRDAFVVGLISGADETANRQEVQKLVTWCSVVNLWLNSSKTKMMMEWNKRLLFFLVYMWWMSWHGIPTQHQRSTRLSRGCIS